jgi:hypothetical protein
VVRAAASRYDARLDQRLDDLFDEEGIAARAFVDELAKAAERRIASKEVSEKLGDLFGA